MTPTTRLEYCVDGIVNGNDVPFDPVTRVEIMLRDIKANTPTALTPVTRIEYYLAKISGVDVDVPEPITRVEKYLAKLAGMDIEVPEPKTRIELWLAEWAEGSGSLVTITGDIVSFLASKVVPIEELKVAINPIQDTHGYDPYPVGYSNNLIPDGKDTTNGYVNGYYIKLDGTTGSDSNWYISEYFQIEAGEDYVWSSKNAAQNTPAICFYDENKEFISGIAGEQSFPKAVTPPSGAVYCRASQCHRIETNGDSGYQLEAGTTATDIKPYSNICPITGVTKRTVFHDNKRVFGDNVAILQGTISSSTGSPSDSNYRVRSDYIPIESDTSYVAKSNFPYMCVYFYKKDATGNFISYQNWSATQTFTTPSNAKYVRFTFAKSTGTNVRVYPTDFEWCNVISSAGETIEVALKDGDDDLTVYGGTLDVISGKLAVDRRIYTLTGEEGWTKVSSGSKSYYALRIANLGYLSYLHDICSHYKTTLINTTTTTRGFGTIGSSNGDSRLAFRPDLSAIDTVDKWQSFLAEQYANGTPVTCVVGISTHLIYHLAPTEVDTLLGENNIWADAGDVTVTAAGIKEITPSSAQALNMLLGGMYTNNHTADDVSDDEALNIILGGSNA